MRVKFEVYQDKAQEFRWRAVAANGQIVATSGEGYTRRDDCADALEELVVAIKADRWETAQ